VRAPPKPSELLDIARKEFNGSDAVTTVDERVLDKEWLALRSELARGASRIWSYSA
jgi:hypothetical protein